MNACPEFADIWNDPDNCFRNDDGSFTFGGVLAEFSHYVRDNYRKVTRTQWQLIANVIESAAVDNNAELRNAINSIFVENLVYETFTNELRNMLGPNTRKLFGSDHRAT